MDASAFSSSANRMAVHRTLRENMLHPYSHVRGATLALRGWRPAGWIFNVAVRSAKESVALQIHIVNGREGFTREGCFNTHNRHLWSDENPLALRTRPAQVCWSINKLAGICGDFILGPCILPDRMDGPPYSVFGACFAGSHGRYSIRDLT